KHVGEITGRTDLLMKRTDLADRFPRAALLDVSRFLQPDMALTRLDEKYPQVTTRTTGVCDIFGDPIAAAGASSTRLGFALNDKILAAAYDAIDTGQNADLVFRVKNSDRSVGATVAGMIAKLYGREGMPNHRKVKVRLDGEA